MLIPTCRWNAALRQVLFRSGLRGRGAWTLNRACSTTAAGVQNRLSHEHIAGAARPLLTLGIPRETYNSWERRVALTPDQVQALLQKNPGRLAVTVQSSARRIFADQDYHQAGATIVAADCDLDHCNVILGVKRPLSVLPGKTYLFFSHTIKGQPENMALLRECLDKKVQLIDYERITTAATGKRLVSFGRFAGIAGTMDSFHFLGRKLLHGGNGASTPFLSFPSAILHDSLDEAKDRVRRLGERVHCEGIALNEPLVIAVTGRGGCVHEGAMEILQLLPHEIVPVSDLPAVLPAQSAKTSSSSSALQYKIHVVPVGMDDVFQRCDDEFYDRRDFQQHPSEYRSLFAKRVAPYAHAIVNCAYWDSRFPRLLTKRQVKRLWEDGNHRLRLIADISCDVHGSVECLERTTTIENPCFHYDPLLEREVKGDVAEGITVMGVDILPTEFPKESSAHFGDKVMGVVEELLDAKERQNPDYDGIDTSFLSSGLSDACITANGVLEPGFQYLKTLMNRVPMGQIDVHGSMTLSLEGHLFDTGLINQILDVIEQYGTGLDFKECFFPPQTVRATSKSNVVMTINAAGNEALSLIEQKINTLVQVIERADATVIRLEQPIDQGGTGAQVPNGSARVEHLKSGKRVLVLGAGRVSKSFVDYMGRSTNATITVVSEKEEEARDAALAAVNGQHMALDVVNDIQRLSAMIEDSDVVVSLLPAPMHPFVAMECIVHGRHLVTASYESEEMRKLSERAQQANVMILNEVGLDPGLDHMSAMKIIDAIKDRGGKITGFTSVCGGLPELKSANNPLKYKFSWSPRGVIRACQNGARFRREGQVMEIKGSQLLQSAVPFVDVWNDHQLECLPNRDSLHYEDVYGIQGVPSIFRGTLRYRGFSSLMETFQNAGLFDETNTAASNWSGLIDELRDSRGGFESVADFIRACADDDDTRADQALSALQLLDMLGENPLPAKSVVDCFCQALERKLVYEDGEHDLVLMHHSIDALFENGDQERHQSNLYVLGDSSMSAMAKTVGFTAAASTELVLDGDLNGRRGLLTPTDPTIYLPVLGKLELEGIVFTETIEVDEARRQQSQ